VKSITYQQKLKRLDGRKVPLKEKSSHSKTDRKITTKKDTSRMELQVKRMRKVCSKKDNFYLVNMHQWDNIYI